MATRRRWAKSLAVLALVVAALGSGGWWVWRSSRETAPRTGPVLLAITPFGMVGPARDPWSGTGLAAELRVGLDTVSGISARLVGAANETAADYVVAGTIGRQGTRNAVAIEVRRRDRTVIWTGNFWRGDSELASLASDLAQAVAISVRSDASRRAVADRRRPR